MVKGIPNHCLSSWAAVLRAGTGFRALLRLTGCRRRRGLRQPYVHPPHVGVVPGPQPLLVGQAFPPRSATCCIVGVGRGVGVGGGRRRGCCRWGVGEGENDENDEDQDPD